MKFDAIINVDAQNRFIFVHVEMNNEEFGLKTHWRKYIQWEDSEDEIEDKLSELETLLQDANSVIVNKTDWSGEPTLADCIKIPPKFENREQFIYDLDTSIQISELWMKHRKRALTMIDKIVTKGDD